MINLVIGENEAGQRTDRFLRKYLAGAPLSAIYRIIRKDCKVNGKRVHEDRILEAGDQVSLYLSQEQMEAYARQVRKRPSARKQFRVIYEDDQVLIVSKPPGLLVHGDSREKRNTLINQVCGYLQDKGEYDPSAEKTFTPAPANRIDRGTSGLVIFGKTAPALRELTRLIRTRAGIRKFYLAVAAGQVREELILTDRLVRDSQSGRVSVSKAGGSTAGGAWEHEMSEGQPADEYPAEGQSAETHVRPLKTGARFSLVEAELITGRTHQIRVHMAQAGYPLAGDPRYGDPGVNRICRDHQISSQLLHAWRLQFGQLEKPLEGLSGRTIEAEPPRAFHRAAEELIHGGV